MKEIVSKEIVFIVPILCCIYFIINLIFYKSNSNNKFSSKINWLYKLIFIAIIGLQTFNIINFLTDNFIFNSVYSHSEKNMESLYKLTAAFSGQEGSFLLWMTCIGFIGLFFNKIIKNDCSKNIFLYNAIFIIFPLFLSIALFWNNPFELTPPKTNIADGLGLKLVLQSYYNLVHPPLIFIGFSIFYILYVIGVTTLLCKSNIDKKIINKIAIFNKLGCLFLTAGIITGSLWAYRTLGWGGFWGWDPIENSALIPLLLSFALLHFNIVNKKSNNENNFLKMIFLLSVLIFPTIILCTFLARSGLLIGNSVHSYIDSNNNIVIYILLFLSLILLLSLFLFFIRVKYLKTFQQLKIPNNLKIKITILGIILLLCIDFIVICGTLIPVIFNKIINTFLEINSNFYMLWGIPLGTIMLLLLGVSTLLKNKKYSFNGIANAVIVPFIISIIIMLVALFYGMIEVWKLIFFFACAFAILGQVQTLIIKIIKEKNVILNSLASFLSHIGLSIFLMGSILYSTFSAEEKIFFEKNKLFETKSGLQCIISNIVVDTSQKYSCISPIINVKYKKNNFILNPKIVFSHLINKNMQNNDFIYHQDKSFSNIVMFPSIVSTGLTDIYIEPLNITANSKLMLMSISVKPYINLVWTGFVILFVGLILYVIKSTK